MGQGYLQRSRRHNHQYGKHRDRASLHGEPPAPKLTLVKPAAKNRLRPGTVIWAHIPFADGSGEKARPAVVDSVIGREVILRPITTSPHRHKSRHHEVIDLRAAGLRKPSAVEARLVVADTIDITQIVGELAPEDRAQVLDHRIGGLVGEQA